MNAQVVENPDEIPLADDLMDRLQNKYTLNTSLLQSFLRASYGNERQGKRELPRHAQSFNVSQVQFRGQVLLYNETFSDYTLVCRRMNALVGLAGTGKTKKLFSFACGKLMYVERCCEKCNKI